ncbi:hypothetical protein CDEST_11130 [Colletotrichum destructivum]|uniref:Uncharacterized protein n=1 Tax=Colletotrichum destructivum TaxID=34406 RepID=A0AAX4ISA4_9PEZI|nr:hypothetical protein CDEST_11130 [Colletotrichum destructivum]
MARCMAPRPLSPGLPIHWAALPRTGAATVKTADPFRHSARFCLLLPAPTPDPACRVSQVMQSCGSGNIRIIVAPVSPSNLTAGSPDHVVGMSPGRNDMTWGRNAQKKKVMTPQRHKRAKTALLASFFMAPALLSGTRGLLYWQKFYGPSQQPDGLRRVSH